VRVPIVLVIVVVMALAGGACSTGKPCAGPYGESPAAVLALGGQAPSHAPPVDMRLLR
jgi:hypothetical protein